MQVLLQIVAFSFQNDWSGKPLLTKGKRPKKHNADGNRTTTPITCSGCCERSARGGGGGNPIWNRRGCSSEILNLTPKGDHLGVAQAFCDP